MSTGLVGTRRRRRKPGPRGHRRERRDPEATRQALLEAGAHLFPVRGFDGVSVEDLAARAGVNKALISYHFGGKRGLYAAVLESSFAEMAKRLRAVEEAGDAREGLRRLFAAFEALTAERPDFPALFLREAVSKGIDPAVVPHLLEIIGITRRLAQRGHRERVFRHVDPLLFHFGLVGALGFFFATEPARRRAARQLPFAMPTPHAFIRHLEEMTLRGLSPEAPNAAKTKPRKRKGARP
jgi:TetR/AcrR family transcriptional regulator